MGERYQVQRPWIEFPPPLTNNYTLAIARLKSQIKKLKDSTDFFQRYNQYFADLLQQQIIKQVPTEIPKNTISHYLPHKEILDITKSTPVRVVFDASAKMKSSNKSLNDCIYKGAP